MEDISEKVIGGFIDYSIQKIDSAAGGLRDKLKHYFGTDLKRYLAEISKRIFYLKTILHRTEPKYLYDFYIPLSVNNGNITCSSDDFIQLIDEKSMHVVLIAQAGAGKSTLIRDLFFKLIAQKRRIPVLVELRNLNKISDDLTIEEYILNEISGENGINNAEIMRSEMKKGGFAFFFDGFDEIYSQAQSRLLQNFQEFQRTFGACIFVVSSRPFANAEMIPGFTNFKVQPFEPKQITDFVTLQLRAEPGRARQINTTIASLPANSPVRSFLTNPLLLSLFILTYQSHSQIPSKRYQFYRKVVETLFQTHDSLSKIGYEREFKSKLTQEQIEEILKRFAFLTYFSQQYTFSRAEIDQHLVAIKKKLTFQFSNSDFIHDLQVSAGLWLDDDGDYTFTHRSLQEYYLAFFITTAEAEIQEKLYQKVLEQIVKDEVQEITNLLLLLKEMAPVPYYKEIILPILDILGEHLKDNDYSITLLNGFISSVSIGENVHNEAGQRLNVSYGILPIFSMFRLLDLENTKFHTFFRFLNIIDDHKAELWANRPQGANNLHLVTRELKSEKFPIVSWTDPIFKPIAEDPAFRETAASLHDLIQKETQFLKDQIQKSIKDDEELINLV